MTASIHYLAHNSLDHTVTFSVAGVRWEYWLNPQACQSVAHLAHKVSTGKAFAYAKRHSVKAERVPYAQSQ